MKIIVAQTAGFCMGVKRAVDLALDHTAHSSKEVYTIGPVIHNKQAIQMLHDRGAKILKSKKSLKKDSKLLIRAHGIPPEEQASLIKTGHEIVDGTCPKVKTVHKVIERYKKQGYHIIIVGDEGHAEVVALQGYAETHGTLIQKPEHISSLPIYQKVCIVAQTTYDRETFDAIAEKAVNKYGHENVVIKKTICAATKKRQEETHELAKMVDALIVVGGKNSANTQRLGKIAREHGTPTQVIETEKDIDFKELKNCVTIGVTAGASTPSWMIKRVVDYLHMLNRKEHSSFGSQLLSIFDILANVNIFAALGAAIMYYVSCYLQSKPALYYGAVLSFLYFFSMYLWNSLSSMEMTQHHGLARYEFYRKHKGVLYLFSVLSVLTLLTMSYLVNYTLFLILLATSLIGSLYHIDLVPKGWRKFFKYHSIKDIPTSRDLFVALAWAVIITFIPQGIANSYKITMATILCFLWIFFLAFLRSVVYDLRDIEGDRIMGRETLVTIVGERKVRQGILFLLQVLSVLLLVFPIVFLIRQHHFGVTSFAFLGQIPVLLYIYLFTRNSRSIGHQGASIFSSLADGQFYISGILAFITKMVFR